MRLLITRAAEEAARTAAKVAQKGHLAILSPVLEMVPTGALWPGGVVDAVLATSAQAFELVSFAPDAPSPEVKRLLPLYLVGTRTGEAAAASGFEGAYKIAPDAKAMAQRIIADLAAPARLLYLAGHDRKPDLETALMEAAFSVEVLEVYAARAAAALAADAVAALAADEIDAVLHYSRRSAEILVSLMQAAVLDPSRLRHVCISPDAAIPIRESGAPDVLVAVEPNEQSILALLDEASSDVTERPREDVAE